MEIGKQERVLEVEPLAIPELEEVERDEPDTQEVPEETEPVQVE